MFCVWQSRKKNYSDVRISKMYTTDQITHNARLEIDNRPLLTATYNPGNNTGPFF
jgi:hypothetical protein